MCGEQSQPHLNKAEDNDRPRADYFWLRLEKAAFDVWPGGGRKGGARDGVSAHLSAEPNNTMATAQRRDEMNDSQREGRQGGGGESLQRPAWHSRLAEQIPLLQLFSEAFCWHRHFGAPAEDRAADLRPEQH